MVKPAELYKHLKYDSTMNATKYFQEYLEKCDNQITSIVEGCKHVTHNIVKKSYNKHPYELHFIEKDYEVNLHFSKQWKETPHGLRNEKLKQMAMNMRKYSNIFCELEWTLRNIPLEEVLKYDIPMLEKHFVQCGNTYEETLHVDFTSAVYFVKRHTSLLALGSAVCDCLAAGMSVAIVTTEAVVLLSHYFRSMCLLAGIPTDAISIYLVQEENVKYLLPVRLSKDKMVFSPITEEGCTVVVTESGDIDSAIDILVSEATSTYVYPWRVDRLLIQESVYEIFQKKLNNKFKHILEDFETLNSSIPRGAKVWQYPEKYKGSSLHYIVYKNVNFREKLDNVTTMEAYRSTKELINLMNNKSRFALSLWCDSVSVTNEISLVVRVSTIWVNMYGVFDNLKLNLDRFCVKSLMGISPPTDSTTKNKFIRSLAVLKKAMVDWKKLHQEERLSACLKHINSIKDDLTDAEYDKLKEMKEKIHEISSAPNSRVKVIDKKLCMRTCEPVGIAFVLVRNVGVLIDVIVSVIEGNGVIHVETDGPVGKILKYLSAVPIIPIVNLDIAGDELDDLEKLIKSANTLNEIQSIFFEGVHINASSFLYYTRSVWSPIGETFTN